ARPCFCVRLPAITFTGMFWWWTAAGWRDDTSHPLLVVGHSSHVVRIRLGSAAKRGRQCVIDGNEVAHDDAHGSITKKLACRVVVGCGDLQRVTSCKSITAFVEEGDNRHA